MSGLFILKLCQISRKTNTQNITDEFRKKTRQREILKITERKVHIIYKGLIIRFSISSDKCQKTTEYLQNDKNNNRKPRFLYLTNLSFKKEDKINLH